MRAVFTCDAPAATWRSHNRKLAAAMLSQGIYIRRPHPPHANCARISVGLPEESQRAQDGLCRTLEETAPNNSSAAKWTKEHLLHRDPATGLTLRSPLEPGGPRSTS
jgi:hypothetical protein